MSIAKLNVKTNEVDVALTQKEIPVFQVGGTIVGEYVAASKAEADAKAKLAECREPIMEDALTKLFEYNLEHPLAPASSVKLVDGTDSRLLVTMQNRYSNIGAASAEEFERLCGKRKLDAGEYVHEVAGAKFDDSIFMAEGEFSPQIYNAYFRAIQATTQQLIADGHLLKGTKNPLRTTLLTVVRPSFHAQRWHDFTSVEDQKLLQGTITATVAIKAAGS